MRFFRSPIFSNVRAASANIPALIPGGDKRDIGKCLQAINNAVACSLKPIVHCSPLPIVKYKVVLFIRILIQRKMKILYPYL